MKKYSAWAKHHKQMARVIIISSFVLLTATGLFTGNLLKTMQAELPSYWLWITSGLYFLTVLAYPFRVKKADGKFAYPYYRQKTCDTLLAATTFFLLIYIGNRPSELFNYSGSLHAAVTIVPSKSDSAGKQYQSLRSFSKSMKDADGKLLKWKERKKLLKQQVKSIRGSAISSTGKALLIILAVLIAAGLIAAVVALSCELTCAGSEAAGTIVLIGGAGLVILLLVLAIRGILGKRKRRRARLEEN